MITIQNEGVKGVIKLPTSIKEITPEVLATLTNNVVLQKHYVILALCWKVKVADILITNKEKKESKVVTLIAKKNVEDEYNWIEEGKVAIVNRSSIEMGTHLHVDTKANMSNIYNHYLEVSKLTNPAAKGVNLNVIRDTPQEPFYLIEFKIVPATDIKAIIDNVDNTKDPFSE